MSVQIKTFHCISASLVVAETQAHMPVAGGQITLPLFPEERFMPHKFSSIPEDDTFHVKHVTAYLSDLTTLRAPF